MEMNGFLVPHCTATHRYLWHPQDPRRGWVDLYGSTPKFLKQSGWRKNPEPWYRKMEETFLFTFVRDPVDKFLSSFYEVHTRNHSSGRIWAKLGVDQYSGMDRLRNLLGMFQGNIMDHMIHRNIFEDNIKGCWK